MGAAVKNAGKAVGTFCGTYYKGEGFFGIAHRDVLDSEIASGGGAAGVVALCKVSLGVKKSDFVVCVIAVKGETVEGIGD